MELGKVIAQIPARGGSKRVPSKNLRYMNGKPMIAYAVQSALACTELEDVYINTDSDTLEELGRSLGCSVYRRPEHLGSDTATGDDFTYDFIMSKKPDTVVMISPVCPLIETADITAALKAYAESDADTLIACNKTHMQTFLGNKPMNIIVEGPLAASQDNEQVIICNWAVTVWNARVFKELYEKNGGGYFGMNRLFWELDPIKAVKVSEEKDFRLAEALLRARDINAADKTPSYWQPKS